MKAVIQRVVKATVCGKQLFEPRILGFSVPASVAYGGKLLTLLLST